MPPTQPSVLDELPHLHPSEFAQIRELMHRRFGIDLRPGKEELIRARLASMMREDKFASFGDYYRHVVDDKTGRALGALADALTTNHTSLFREPAHFDFLRTLLAAATPMQTTHIWSAACSTGEEPYSIACSAIDELGAARAKASVRILASDISMPALRAAKEGIYPESRFEELPVDWRRRHLLRGSGRWQNHYRFKDHVRSLVRFKRINLVDPFPISESFAVIFCRNVLIYFDSQTRDRVVERLAERLDPQGYLLVGHAEGLFAQNHSLTYVSPAVYQQRNRSARNEK